MGRSFVRLFVPVLLSALLTIVLRADPARSQDSKPAQQLINPGDAIVTGFSGILEVTPGEAGTAGGTAGIRSFIDPDGASLRGFDLNNPSVAGPFGQPVAPEFLSVTARDIGQVFGIALDNATDPVTGKPTPSIYATATSVYGLPIVGADDDADGAPDKLARGASNAKWMDGLFGLKNGGGPGSIWKIDGVTGNATLLADITHDGRPNSGAALGNIAFDPRVDQLFVSDRDTGLIHRLDLEGRVKDAFDHGVSGRGADRLDAVPIDPANRADITQTSFKPSDPSTWGLTEPRRRVWGLAVHKGRLYYAVADGPQIWSVGLREDGGFDAVTARRELDLGGEFGVGEIADIAFTGDGKMVLAQRPAATGATDFVQLVEQKPASILRYERRSGNDQEAESRWVSSPGEYAIGATGDRRSALGGVALGFGYADDGRLDRTACSAMVWGTGDGLSASPLAAAGREEKASAGLVDGIEGMRIDQIRDGNQAPAPLLVIDYDGQYPEGRRTGHVGDVEIAHPCPEDALTQVPTPPVTAGPDAPIWPGPGVPGGPGPGPGGPVAPGPLAADLAIEKQIAGPCAQGVDCQFQIVVRNLGPGDYLGPLLVSDIASVPNVNMTGAPGGAWSCQQGGGQVTCSRPTLLIKPGLTAKLPLRLTYTGNPNIGSWQNCAELTWLGQGPGNKDTVRAVQAELTRLGYYSGAIDGIPGSGTRQAIRALEQAVGLPQTGNISPTLLEWMFGAGASTASDPNAGNDRACVTVPTQPPPSGPPPQLPSANTDLAIEKGPSHPAITVLNCSVDKPCKFSVTITNKGPKPYTGPIIIKDELLPGFTLSSWSGPSLCQQKGTVFSCGLVPQTTLAVGQSIKWDFTLKLPSSAPSSARHIQNCAELDWKSGPGDIDTSNDKGCTTIVVAPGPPELQISKKAGSKTCERGKDCVYKITVTNKGKTPHHGPISIEDRNFKSPGIKLSSYGPKPPWTCTQTALGKYRCDHPATTLKPGDSLPELTLNVFIPTSVPDKVDQLKNCAAITQGSGKVGKERCINVPIKPGWDLRITKTGPKICYPEAQGFCNYRVDVRNAGKVQYEGGVVVVEINTVQSISLRGYKPKPWICKDGPGPGNIRCEHPHVVLKPGQSLPALTIQVDLHQKVPPQIKAITDCAKVFYKGGQPDADPKNDQSCISTPLHRGGATVTGSVSPNVILGILFPVNCIVVDIAGAATGQTLPAGHLGCTDYEFTITNEGKAAHQGPMTLRVGIPPGSKFAKAHGKVSVPTCVAGGWSCTPSAKEIVCRQSGCDLRPGEKASVLTDITLLGGGRVHIPPEGLPKTVCGELEWFAKRDPSDIEQQGERRISRACGTTLVLLKKQPKTDLEIATHPRGQCAVGRTCLLTDEIINTGPKAFSGLLEFQGQVQPPVSIRAIRPVQGGWSCRTIGGGRYACRIPSAAFAPGSSAQFQLALAIPRNFQHGEITHSVRLVWPRGTGDAKPENDRAAVTVPIGAREAQPAPEPQPCTGGKVRYRGQCVCPRGTQDVRGKCVPVKATPPPPCTGGKVRWRGRCVCPRGTQDIRGRCTRIPPPPPRCTGGKVPVRGQCLCPRGTQDVRGRCTRIPPPPPRCTGGKVPVGSQCVCPRGTQDIRGRCVRPQPKAPPPAAPPKLKVIPMQPIPNLKVICPRGQKWVKDRCLPIVQ